jgi:hypothetical protein
VLAVEDALGRQRHPRPLRHVGRRVDDLPALLLLTYRPDEVTRSTRCRACSAASAAAWCGGCWARSPDAVAELADGSPLDARRLHRATAGNPFFVTEALASPDDPVPRPSSMPCWPA